MFYLNKETPSQVFLKGLLNSSTFMEKLPWTLKNYFLSLLPKSLNNSRKQSLVIDWNVIFFLINLIENNYVTFNNIQKAR